MTATALYIPDILEEHLDELPFLWWQRRVALRSPLYTMRELGDLEERIEAHVHGVLAIGEARAGSFIADRLAADDADAVFGAAFASLRFRTNTGTRAVLDAFSFRMLLRRTHRETPNRKVP